MLQWLARWFERPAVPKRDLLGDRGENLAARLLRDKGYSIITRNFRCEVGEIDIVARDGKTLVFVEVKTRETDEPPPEANIGSEKQQRLTRAGKVYLTRYGVPPPPARFDVVAIVWPPGKPPEVRHTPGAFEAAS